LIVAGAAGLLVAAPRDDDDDDDGAGIFVETLSLLPIPLLLLLLSRGLRVLCNAVTEAEKNTVPRLMTMMIAIHMIKNSVFISS